ncbi:MAG TPA: hypothetical protein PLS03_15730 [Terrimicrobiaceae bacterium]|nr:hypothetical protein [Terrimicrobiaceae bacterium]
MKINQPVLSFLAAIAAVTCFSTKVSAFPVSWSEAPDISNCYYYFPANGSPGCSILSVWNAWMDRSDSNAVITDQGTPDVVQSSESPCDNCGSESANSCTDSLEVTFTESLSVSIESGIEAGIDELKASLKSTIGAEQGRERKYTKSCTANPAACSKINVTLEQNIRNGVAAEIVSSYECHHDLLAGASPCASYVNAAGARTSSATGSVGLMTGSCKFVDVECPPKDCPPCQKL